MGHVPDFTTPDGLTDLIVFACGIKLQNAICPLSHKATDDKHVVAILKDHGLSADNTLYKYDFSQATHEMCVQNVHSCGRVLALLLHIFARIAVTDVTTGSHLDPWFDLFIPTLAWFSHTMLAYAKLVSHKLFDLFQCQMKWTAKWWPELETSWQAFRQMEEQETYRC